MSVDGLGLGARFRGRERRRRWVTGHSAARDGARRHLAAGPMMGADQQPHAEGSMTDRDAAAIVLRPGEGRAIDLGNFVMSLKVSGDETRNAFSLLEAAEPADFGPPMHIHHDCAEAFFVLEGEYRIFVETAEFDCPAGSFIFIPSGLRHGFRVGPLPSRKLNLYAPAAMVGYFDSLSAAITGGDADPGRVPEGYL
jgi:mannose-6-phosphate isomerase-like protein (cupin superfamily)